MEPRLIILEHWPSLIRPWCQAHTGTRPTRARASCTCLENEETWKKICWVAGKTSKSIIWPSIAPKGGEYDYSKLAGSLNWIRCFAGGIGGIDAKPRRSSVRSNQSGLGPGGTGATCGPPADQCLGNY